MHCVAALVFFVAFAAEASGVLFDLSIENYGRGALFEYQINKVEGPVTFRVAAGATLTVHKPDGKPLWLKQNGTRLDDAVFDTMDGTAPVNWTALDAVDAFRWTVPAVAFGEQPAFAFYMQTWFVPDQVVVTFVIDHGLPALWCGEGDDAAYLVLDTAQQRGRPAVSAPTAKRDSAPTTHAPLAADVALFGTGDDLRLFLIDCADDGAADDGATFALTYDGVLLIDPDATTTPVFDNDDSVAYTFASVSLDALLASNNIRPAGGAAIVVSVSYGAATLTTTIAIEDARAGSTSAATTSDNNSSSRSSSSGSGNGSTSDANGDSSGPDDGSTADTPSTDGDSSSSESENAGKLTPASDDQLDVSTYAEWLVAVLITALGITCILLIASVAVLICVATKRRQQQQEPHLHVHTPQSNLYY